IGAGAERAALGGEHDRAAGRVGIEPLEGFADLGDQRAVEEIMRRPAHLDGRDEAVEVDADFLEAGVVAHLRSPEIQMPCPPPPNPSPVYTGEGRPARQRRTGGGRHWRKGYSHLFTI